MHHTSIPTNPALTRQHRMREIVKRLVIELGYLEYCLAAGLEDTNLQTAALSIDTAIDCLNEHLVS